MKNKLFLASLFVTLTLILNRGPTLSVSANTIVGGPIISDTTWTISGSPYIVTLNVQIFTGVTLTIDPGVVIKFNNGTLLQVDGTLIARGTSSNMIIFTSNQVSPQPGNWNNIYFNDDSTDATFDSDGNYISGSVLQYCSVEYAGGNSANGAIETNSASPFVDHCIIRNNQASGIRGYGTPSSNIIISNNTVDDNTSLLGGGIYAVYGMVKDNNIYNNSAVYDGGGIYASNSTVISNTVKGNAASYLGYGGGTGGGIFAWHSSMVAHNTVTNNSAAGGGGITIDSGTGTDNWVSNNSAYDGGGIRATSDIFICTVTNNIVIANSAHNGGGIQAFGSTVTGNFVSNNFAVNGGGMALSGGTPTTNNVVMANRVSVTGQGAGIYFSEPNDFLYNTIVRNTTDLPTTAIIGGVTFGGSGSPQVSYNNIYGNSPYDLVNELSQDISGTYNYWGTVNATDILAHVYDWYDDTSRGRLLFSPYLSNPAPGAPPLWNEYLPLVLKNH